MDIFDVRLRCRQKADEILEKYFPNFIQEATVTRPEVLAPEYTDDLPSKIEEEFRTWLSGFWKEVSRDSASSFERIMNKQSVMGQVDNEYLDQIERARESAVKITFWEKLTKTNHKDVTFYKGLLKEYSEELMNAMIEDFIEDVK